MPKYHFGLQPNSPVQAIVLEGHSFQKESWTYDAEGAHAPQAGIVAEIDDEDFKAKALKDAEGRFFRIWREKDGSVRRAEERDTRIPGFKIQKDLDQRVSDFVYVKKVDESFRATPPSLTEPEAVVASGAPSRKKAPGKRSVDVMTPADLDDDSGP